MTASSSTRSRSAVLAALALVLAGATVSGCRPRPAGAGGNARKLMVGPGLDRLNEMLFGTARTEAQKQDYWKAHRGKLVPFTGTVVRTSETSVVLLCPLEKVHGRSMLVEGEPLPELRTALPMFKQGQRLTVRGELTIWNPKAGSADSPEPAFIVTNARIQIR